MIALKCNRPGGCPDGAWCSSHGKCQHKTPEPPKVVGTITGRTQWRVPNLANAPKAEPKPPPPTPILAALIGELHYQCDPCEGTGKCECYECGGTGKLDCLQCRGAGNTTSLAGGASCEECESTGKRECWRCESTGRSSPCSKCDGQGKRLSDAGKELLRLIASELEVAVDHHDWTGTVSLKRGDW